MSNDPDDESVDDAAAPAVNGAGEATPESDRRRRDAWLAGGTRSYARVGAKVTGAFISAVLLLAAGYGWYNFAALNNNEHVIPVSGLGSSTPAAAPVGDTTAAAASSSAPAVDGIAENILIVGIDSRAGLTRQQEEQYKVGNDTSTSTDTIMIVHVPADGSKATLISIPRDSWVHIDGFGYNKINSAYADGYYYTGAQGSAAQQAAGASLLVSTVKELTGVQIDHYVQVGFSGFVNIVKAIGSIPINLCQSVDDTVQYNRDHGETGGSGFHMSAGPHDLTPTQALEFVRQRHNIPGPVTDDFGRELRQRYFLSAAFKKILSAGVLLNPFKLHSLIQAVDNAFVFDNNFDITKFAEQMTNLTAGNITGRSIPSTAFVTSDGQDALRVDPTQVQKVVQQAFYGSASSSGHHHHKKRHAGGTKTADKGCVY